MFHRVVATAHVGQIRAARRPAIGSRDRVIEIALAQRSAAAGKPAVLVAGPEQLSYLRGRTIRFYAEHTAVVLIDSNMLPA